MKKLYDGTPKKCLKCGIDIFKSNNLSMHKWGTTNYCSLKCYRKILSERNRSSIKELNHSWKGDKISYGGMHMRLKRYRGTAKECIFCRRQGNIDWANTDGNHIGVLEHYQPMCKSCHKRYDMFLSRNNVYFPYLSNINPGAALGKCGTYHSHVWIGDRVKIGDRCRIQAFCFIPTGVRIGDDVFIGPRVTFTNDKHPPSDEWLVTIVEDHVSIGGGAVILPGLTLGKGCKIGAGAVVTKSVPPGETWVGNPAQRLRRSLDTKLERTQRP